MNYFGKENVCKLNNSQIDSVCRCINNFESVSLYASFNNLQYFQYDLVIDALKKKTKHSELVLNNTTNKIDEILAILK